MKKKEKHIPNTSSLFHSFSFEFWMAALAVILGCVLRLLFPTDIEYKYDEAWMFTRTQAIGQGEDWPLIGMISGQGLPNPALSVWIFAIAAKLFQIQTPVALAQVVSLTNSLALVLFFVWVWKFVKDTDEQKKLFLGLAFFSVSIFAILFSRKIWAQSFLPPLALLIYVLSRFKEKFWPSFFMGLIALAMGQIHMSGFFFFAALVCSLFVFERKQTHFTAFALGSLLGALPLIPWLLYLYNHPSQTPSVPFLEASSQFYFYRFFFSDLLSQGIEYSLGANTRAFETPFIKICQVVITVIFGFLIAGKLTAVLNCFSPDKLKVKLQDQLSFYAFLSLIPLGILFTLSNLILYRHYLIVISPFVFFVFPLLANLHTKISKRAIMVLFLATATISVSFTHFIHENCGSPQGDYWISYRCQKPQ